MFVRAEGESTHTSKYFKIKSYILHIVTSTRSSLLLFKILQVTLLVINVVSRFEAFPVFLRKLKSSPLLIHRKVFFLDKEKIFTCDDK